MLGPITSKMALRRRKSTISSFRSDPFKPVSAAFRIADLGVRALKMVRQDLLEDGSSRQEINRQVGRIRRMVRWAIAEDWPRPRSSSPLKPSRISSGGRTTARECPPVTPVPEAWVDATLPLRVVRSRR